VTLVTDYMMISFGNIQVRACSASMMVIGHPDIGWWHPGSQTECEHKGEPQEVRWVSGGHPLEVTDEMIETLKKEMPPAYQDRDHFARRARAGIAAVLALVSRSVPSEELLEVYRKGYREGQYDTASEKGTEYPL
jgi:hypothetical protein